MKNINTKNVLLLIISVLIFSKINAQPMFDLNVISPVTLNNAVAPVIGIGGGIGLYSSAINLSGSRYNSYNKYRRNNYQPDKQPPFCVRFGGEASIANMGYKHLDNMPLLAPESGTAKVYFGNTFYTVNGGAKFYASCFNSKLLPYAEVFAGLRGYNSNMTIQPDDGTANTSSHITKTEGIDVGGSAGLLIKVGGVFLDAGVMLTHSEVPGNYADLTSLQRIGNTADMQLIDIPANYLVYKVGIVALIDDDGKGSSGGRSSGSFWTGIGHSCGHIGSGLGHSHINIHLH